MPLAQLCSRSYNAKDARGRHDNASYLFEALVKLAVAPAAACSLLTLFDALVQYRNLVFGHGAARFDSFYGPTMGPLLFPAINEVLAEGVFEFLGPSGSRLVQITEVRTLDERRRQAASRELVGLHVERLTPLELTSEQATELLSNRVALSWPGRPAPRRLEPLLKFREGELADEVLFLTAELRTCKRRDNSGNRVNLNSAESQERWRQLTRLGGPATPFTPEQRDRIVTAWHRNEADDSERSENWFAAALHLKRLLKRFPQDAALKELLDQAREKLAESSAPTPPQPANRPPPPTSAPPPSDRPPL